MTNQVPESLSEISAVPVTTAASTKSIQDAIQPIATSKVSENSKTHEDVEEGIAPEVLPLSAIQRLAQAFSPSNLKIPTRLRRRPRIHISLAGCVERLLIGIAFVFLLILLLVGGAVVISALAQLGVLVMLLGAMIFKPSSYVPSDKHVALIGAVGASASALGIMITAIPFGLIMFDDSDYAFIAALLLFILTLMVSGPIGIAIVHRFGFELQMSVGQATKLSVVGFFIIVVGVSLVAFAVYSCFRKL